MGTPSLSRHGYGSGMGSVTPPINNIFGSPDPSPHRIRNQLGHGEKNTANGGIGVSYSNVVLHGGLSPGENNIPKSSYQQAAQYASIGQSNGSINRARFQPPNGERGGDQV